MRALRFSEVSSGKLSIALSFLLTGVLTRDLGTGAFTHVLAALTAVMAWGYVVNDVADRHEDAISGRAGVVARLSAPWRLATVGALFFLAVGAIWALGSAELRTLGYAQLGLAAAYSLPPARLKRRTWWGLGAAVGAQYVIPAGMILISVAGTAVPDAVFTLLLIVGLGTTLEIGHQDFDRERDEATGTRTAMATLPRPQAKALYRVLLLASGVLLALLPLYLMVRVFGRLGGAWEAALLAVPLGIVIQLLVVIWLGTGGRPHRINDPFYASEGNVVDRFFTSFPNFFLPAFLGTVVAASIPSGWICALVTLVWVRCAFHQEELSWFARQIRSLARAPELGRRSRRRIRTSN